MRRLLASSVLSPRLDACDCAKHVVKPAILATAIMQALRPPKKGRPPADQFELHPKAPSTAPVLRKADAA